MTKNILKKLTSLKETRFLSLYDAEYDNRTGNEKHWIIASRKDFKTLSAQFFDNYPEKIDAAVIAAYHKDTKKLVIIKQFRLPLNDYVYELPAGLLDRDEEIEETVRRELKEETGLKLDRINYEKSNMKVYISAGMTDESVALVYCTCTGTLSKDFLEDDEDIEPLMVSMEEAKELLKSNVKMDIKAATLLQTFSEFGEKIF